VRKIGCNPRGVDHIVESKFVDQGARFQEERERLEVEMR
jgi:hypothetical protein